MPTIPNKVRERLAAGQLSLGMALRQARTVDIGRVLAACGFDFAFIDMEHNTMGIDTAAQIAVACHDAGVTPIVRVPGYEHYLATRLLDAGAMGIVFPHVDTAEQAGQLVSNCKYPPVGHRSLGGPVAQLGFRAYPRAESTALVNQETLLVMMLETPTAIDNADAIAAVPGVDVLLIGTNDLTLEMGIPGRYDDDRVMKAYDTVVAACQRHGKHPGMGGIYDHPTMERYIKRGARFVLCGSDMQFLMAGGQARADFLRGIKV
ncbi:MAG TPA: aldolase/citrate lyase family protein [Methylomirabilota bacterium]|jgi:2-keto-3-deoxy-L-rhamnonate aldolase RhmA|nr:aldolase/citrate lyase family protein [Methylomirabilota bacterium]